MNRTNSGLVRKYLRSKMPSLKFTLSKWLNYDKGFGIMAIVIENNRIHCQTYCLTIEYYSLDQELYVVNFTALNSNYKLYFRSYCNQTLISIDKSYIYGTRY